MNAKVNQRVGGAAKKPAQRQIHVNQAMFAAPKARDTSTWRRE
jgi:hypothetical protein